MHFNSHTHQALERSIQNQFPSEDTARDWFSVGIHPWYVEDWENQLSLIAERVMSLNCLAIGECGFDRICKTDITTQEKSFLAQIELANEFNKPLIIHCVRGYDLLAKSFKIIKPCHAVVLHGFNQKLSTLPTHKEVYLSLGAALLKDNSNAQKALVQFPLERILFETDDDQELQIEDVYHKAAQLLNLTLAKLESVIEHNFKEVFHVEI